MMTELTKIHMTEEDRNAAVYTALRVTMSPHEWTWTEQEQTSMAQLILWQSTEISKLLAVADAAQAWATECRDDLGHDKLNLTWLCQTLAELEK